MDPFSFPPSVSLSLSITQGDHGIFSRAGMWRGPLSTLPKSTLLQLPPPPPPLTPVAPAAAGPRTAPVPTLELVLLPEQDDGSLFLSLARAQLSVPLLRGRHAPVVLAPPTAAPAPLAATAAAVTAAAGATASATTATATAAAIVATAGTAATEGDHICAGTDGIEDGGLPAIVATAGIVATEDDHACAGTDGNEDGGLPAAVAPPVITAPAAASVDAALPSSSPSTLSLSLSLPPPSSAASTLTPPEDTAASTIADAAGCAGDAAALCAESGSASDTVVVAPPSGIDGGQGTLGGNPAAAAAVVAGAGAEAAPAPASASAATAAAAATASAAAAAAAAAEAAEAAAAAADSAAAVAAAAAVGGAAAGAAVAGAAATATAAAAAAAPPKETWGLETDVVGILAVEGLGRERGRGERRRLARAALRAGDVDRLLLCLGRLEGEAPRTRGGRADKFDDPAAVAERARDREEGSGGRPAAVRSFVLGAGGLGVVRER